MPWKKLSSRSVYKSPWTELTVDELETESGKRLTWDFVHKKPFALVIPWDGKHFTLVGLYRYPVDKFSWEFPAGFLDDKSDEQTAIKELREETGLSASSMQKLGYFYVANGFTDNACHVFFATGLQAGEHEREDAEEGMQTKKVTLAEFKEMIRTNTITDGPTISAFALMMELIEF